MLLIDIIEKELRMFFRYPLRVFSAVSVGIVFLLQFVFFGQAVLGGYSQLLASSTGIGVCTGRICSVVVVCFSDGGLCLGNQKRTPKGNF